MPESSADDDLIRALPSDDCPVGTAQDPALRRARVGDSDVLLCRLGDGEVVAFATRCPHQGTDLIEATFFDGRLRCPHHLYLYDPRTGENVVPSRDARPENLWKLKPSYLPVHRVEERDGWIWVSERACPPPPAYDPDRERRPEGARRATAEILSDLAGPGAADTAGKPGPVEHPPKTLRVRPGATFELRLPVSPRPGYVWRVETSPGLMTVVQERFDPGPPPRQRIGLTAQREGVASVRCLYARPWDAEPAEIRTYVVRIEAPAPAASPEG